MNIYNEDKTQIITDYDLALGRLEKSTITTHINAVEGVEEKGHYETVNEYPNGGKDVEWVVDVEGIQAVEAHDVVEDIMIYVPYTEAELQKNADDRRIIELKANLSATDYKAIKYAEGVLTAEEYAETKAQREAWRVELNSLGQ